MSNKLQLSILPSASTYDLGFPLRLVDGRGRVVCYATSQEEARYINQVLELQVQRGRTVTSCVLNGRLRQFDLQDLAAGASRNSDMN